jgi:TolA-binding protein
MPSIAEIITELQEAKPMPQMAMPHMGNSNFAQIQDMDQQLIALQGRVNELTGAVNTLVGVIDKLQKSVQRIENQLPPVAPPAKPGDRNLLV